MKSKILLLLGFSLLVGGCGKKDTVLTFEEEPSEVMSIIDSMELLEPTRGESPSRIYIIYDDDLIQEVSIETANWDGRLEEADVSRLEKGNLLAVLADDTTGVTLGNKQPVMFKVDSVTQAYFELRNLDDYVAEAPIWEDGTAEIHKVDQIDNVSMYEYTDKEFRLYSYIATCNPDFDPEGFAMDLKFNRITTE